MLAVLGGMRVVPVDSIAVLVDSLTVTGTQVALTF